MKATFNLKSNNETTKTNKLMETLSNAFVETRAWILSGGLFAGLYWMAAVVFLNKAVIHIYNQ